MANETANDHQHPPVPEVMTLPGWNFQREYARLFAFVVYITKLAISTDEKAQVAARALYKTEDPEKYRASMENIEKHGATRALRKLHRSMLLEMMLSRAAENFLAYMTELLAVVFRARPETLRSSETVRLDTVLKHATMEELVHELAERRVNQLSYQGMRDLSAYLSDRLAFELFPKPEHLERAVRIVESRNLIVHNRGLVNELFLSRVPGVSAKVGERLDLDSNQIFDDLEFIALLVYEADARAIKKFKLSAVGRLDSSGAA